MPVATPPIAVVQAVPPEPVDVVVRARRAQCDVSVANRILSDRDFNRRAAEWAAGTPVRVLAPTRSDIRCLAKITFRLADKGVRNVEFVDSAPTTP